MPAVIGSAPLAAALSVVDGGQGSHLDFQFEGFDQGHRQHDRIDGHDAKRLQLAVMSADGNILAGQKRMCAEFVTGLIVVVFIGIVVEHPAGVLGATGLVDQTTNLVLLACPKSPNPAVVAILLPEQRVDASLGVERRNKVVAVRLRSTSSADMSMVSNI